MLKVRVVEFPPEQFTIIPNHHLVSSVEERFKVTQALVVELLKQW